MNTRAWLWAFLGIPGLKEIALMALVVVVLYGRSGLQVVRRGGGLPPGCCRSAARRRRPRMSGPRRGLGQRPRQSRMAGRSPLLVPGDHRGGGRGGLGGDPDFDRLRPQTRTLNRKPFSWGV